MTPKSLADVARRVLAGGSFDLCLRNFLDEFQANPSTEALAEEPPLIAGTNAKAGLVKDAFLAATAESLAVSAKFEAPKWAFAESRKLRRPWFALDYASMRAVLLWESPAPFRSRNLFVSENALSRA